MIRPPPSSPLFPSPPLFRSDHELGRERRVRPPHQRRARIGRRMTGRVRTFVPVVVIILLLAPAGLGVRGQAEEDPRSEEHTSELQSRQYLVCRLLLEKKKVL